MPKVEVFDFDGEKDELLFIGDFAFHPRLGETISKDAGGYFKYYDVVRAWHREVDNSGKFQACIAVKLDD